MQQRCSSEAVLKRTSLALKTSQASRPNTHSPTISWLAENGMTSTATSRSAHASDTMNELARIFSRSNFSTLTITRMLPPTAAAMTTAIATLFSTVTATSAPAAAAGGPATPAPPAAPAPSHAVERDAPPTNCDVVVVKFIMASDERTAALPSAASTHDAVVVVTAAASSRRMTEGLVRWLPAWYRHRFVLSPSARWRRG